MMQDELIDRVLEVMNRAIGLDRRAVEALVGVRVLCNYPLANDPDIQVRVEKEGFSLGLVGLLNGIVGGGGLICAEFDSEKRLLRFKRPPGNDVP